MPKLNNTAELQAEALKRKQERDKVAQANWVAKNKEVHLERMREQYQKKKAKLLAEKVARGEVPVVKPVPVVAVQPPNQLKNGTIDNSTLADAIKKIKDDYARVRVFKVYGASPSQAQQDGFMRDLIYPADLVVKNKSKLTPAHLSAIAELGKDLTSILHHDFVVKKTRKLKVKVDTSEREAKERAMMEAEDRNAPEPKPKPKRKLKKIVIAEEIVDTDDEEEERLDKLKKIYSSPNSYTLTRDQKKEVEKDNHSIREGYTRFGGVASQIDSEKSTYMRNAEYRHFGKQKTTYEEQLAFAQSIVFPKDFVASIDWTPAQLRRIRLSKVKLDDPRLLKNPYNMSRDDRVKLFALFKE